MDIEIRVQAEALDPFAETLPVYQGNASVGGVVSFIGLMRDFNVGQAVQGMTLEHYPGMTEKALQAIVDQAGERWNLESAMLIHRVGRLQPQDPIVLVAVASAHRGEAFRGCEFIIDYLKTRADVDADRIGDRPTGGERASALSAASRCSARAASRGVAASSTATRNRALLATRDALDGARARLADANAEHSREVSSVTVDLALHTDQPLNGIGLENLPRTC